MALRAADDDAFAILIDRLHSTMVRVAAQYVSDDAVAEEVVQETWLGVLHAIRRFEPRASLETWIFRILANRARTYAEREARSIPFSALSSAAQGANESDAEPGWLPLRAGVWTSAVPSRDELPEERLLVDETSACLRQALASLPPSQRAVLRLRDLEGWSAAEVCTELGISEANQRVLLHRARARLRRAVEPQVRAE